MARRKIFPPRSFKAGETMERQYFDLRLIFLDDGCIFNDHV